MSVPLSKSAPDAQNTTPTEEAAQQPADQDRPRRAAAAVHSGLLLGALNVARAVGNSVYRAVTGGGDEPPAAGPTAEPPRAAAAQSPAAQKASLLQNVADKLRGAADSYLAAKMDEIEARVDAKLDEIEGRIDRKIAELHDQLVEMRDRELRHRLRLLKLTLGFTALVALLSLGYKWVTKYWMS